MTNAAQRKAKRQRALETSSRQIDTWRKQGITIIAAPHTHVSKRDRVINLERCNWGGGFWRITFKNSIYLTSKNRGITNISISNDHGEKFNRQAKVTVDDAGYARFSFTLNGKEHTPGELIGTEKDRPFYKLVGGIFRPV